MKTSRLCTLISLSLLPALAFGQTAATDQAAVTGTVAVGGGGTFLSGNRGTFQQVQQQQSDGFGGIENLQISKDLGNDTSLLVEGRALLGDRDFLFHLNWNRSDTWLVDAGFQSYRVWYDGSGGYFAPTQTWLPVNGSVLALDRGHAWLDLAFAPPEKLNVELRYDLFYRRGDKEDSEWGDINVPVYGTRAIVPSVLHVDERIHVLALKLSQSTDAQQWAVQGRYEHDSIDDQWLVTRQPGTSIQRDLTTASGTSTNIFTASGSYQRQLAPGLTFSAGAMGDTLDTNLAGNRIYGSTFDAAFNPTSANRQSHDEGYLDLTGGAELKEYVGDINLDYRPAPGWQTTAAFKFDDVQNSNVSYDQETAVNTPTTPAAISNVASQSTDHWLDSSEELEALYTGLANWTFTARADLDQGNGNLVQDGLDVDAAALTSFNNTDYSQRSQKYSAMANWYARPGLTFSVEGYYRLVADNYNGIINLTPADYPQYITNEDLATTDLNVRVSWRPVALFNFTTRYDLQRTVCRNTMTGLPAADSGIYTSHIISESVTATPAARLYVNASASVAYNQLKTPATDLAPLFLANGDNNYLTGTVGAGYALDKLSDLFLDYTGYKAFSDFVNNAATTLPFGAGERVNTVSLTWVRRQTARLVYTVKYTYAIYRDDTVGGINNYTGNMLYAKVEYKF